MNDKIGVLLVCTANICRSPMAESIFHHLITSAGITHAIDVDSAGTHASSNAFAPDPRAIKVLKEHDIDVHTSGSRQISSHDFSRFDYLLVMDQENYNHIMELCPQEYRGKVMMLTDYFSEPGITEIPDPYFGNLSGFKRVYGILELSINAFLEKIRAVHQF